MLRLLKYASAILAALALGGAAATTVSGNASDTENADSSLVSSSPYASRNLPTDYTDNGAVSSSSSSVASSSSSAVSSTSSSKPTAKPEKVVPSAKKLRGRAHYRKYSRLIRFQKGRRGDFVTLRDRHGRFVASFKVRHNGKFDVRLSRHQAYLLSHDGGYFQFTVQKKGYRAYTIHYKIYA